MTTTDFFYLCRELYKDKYFENDKIKIKFDRSSVGRLYVFLKDEKKELYPILTINALGKEDINKANDKILNFVYNKMNEWIEEGKKENEKKHEEKIIKNREKEKTLNNLIYNF